MENIEPFNYYERLADILLRYGDYDNNEEYEKLISTLNTFDLKQLELANIFYSIGEYN